MGIIAGRRHKILPSMRSENYVGRERGERMTGVIGLIVVGALLFLVRSALAILGYWEWGE